MNIKIVTRNHNVFNYLNLYFVYEVSCGYTNIYFQTRWKTLVFLIIHVFFFLNIDASISKFECIVSELLFYIHFIFCRKKLSDNNLRENGMIVVWKKSWFRHKKLQKSKYFKIWSLAEYLKVSKIEI